MTGSDSKSQVESDLDRANERLSFYEQFDEIIKQNIVSSSALLREASARFDSDVAEERNKYRALLSGILDDLTMLQAQSERLARRVNDALDDLETRLPSVGEAPTVSVAPAIAAEAPPEAAAVVNSPTGGTRKKPERTKPVPPPAVTAAETAAAAPAAPLPPVAPVAEMPPTGPTSTTLLVHGVPRASAALGLKSYIEKLDFVSTVEPREFAAGLLRLQVDGARPLTLGDLAGWNMANRIELKTASNELLELGLTPV